MTKGRIVAVIATAAAVALAPVAWADPDPLIPNGSADWCPGGKRPSYGGGTDCLGQPFPDGTFYVQSWRLGTAGPFGPGSWMDFAMCSRWSEGSVQGALPGGCGGVPLRR